MREQRRALNAKGKPQRTGLPFEGCLELGGLEETRRGSGGLRVTIGELRVRSLLGRGSADAGTATRPIDRVLDDTALQSVSSDSEHTRGFNDRTALFKGGNAKGLLGSCQVVGVQRHGHVGEAKGSVAGKTR